MSIRVKNLDGMHKFYEEVIGLEVLPTGGCARRDESFVFFKVAEGLESVLTTGSTDANIPFLFCCILALR